jgi:hypothetical protein
MLTLIISFLLALTPFGQEIQRPMFEIRARQNLMMGTGETTRSEYWDVVITRQPTAGVLLKLPYTRKGGKLSFDLHHRVAMSDDFGAPAEITTVVEVLSGGTNSLGVYAISDLVKSGDRFEESIVRVSNAEIDRYVTPLSRKTITMDIRPGPQSISIVGQTLTITRGAATTRIDTPGTRIATVSNFKFEEVTETNPLKKTTGSF